MTIGSLIKKAARNQYRVIEDPEFWTPVFCRAFFDWCDQQAYDNPDGVLIRGELALELAKKTDDPHAVARAHGVKASAYRMLSLYERSEAELTIGFRYAESCPCCLSELYRRQGILRIHERLFAEAIPIFDAAISNCQKNNDRDGIGRVLVSRGVALWKLNQIEEALHSQHEALSLLSPLAPQIYHLGVLANIAQFLATASEKVFAHAENYCVEFRAYLAGLDGFTAVRVRLSWAHGLILVRLGERKRGLQMLRSARKALMHAGQGSEVVAITADISRIYCDTGKYHFIASLVREVISECSESSEMSLAPAHCWTRSFVRQNESVLKHLSVPLLFAQLSLFRSRIPSVLLSICSRLRNVAW